MLRVLKKLLCMVVGLAFGIIVTGLPWALFEAVGWTPVGPASLVLSIASIVLAGFAAAAMYTYLNDGGDALRGVVRGQPAPRRHHRV